MAAKKHNPRAPTSFKRPFGTNKSLQKYGHLFNFDIIGSLSGGCMFRTIRRAALMLCFLGTPLAGAAPLEPGRLGSFVDARVHERMSKDHVAGVSVAVVQNGRIILLRGYGLAGIRPNRPVDPARTLFGLASTSKIFTWITLLRAAEAGRVDLNRPVNDYLPPELKIPANGFKKQIRLVDLLRHTTGFEDRDVMLLSPSFFGGHQPSIGEYLKYGLPERQREPGKTPSYSNYSPNLAAFIALKGSGASDFDSLVERDLFRPLGMVSTTFREPTLAGSRLPVPMSAELVARRTQNLLWTGTNFAIHPYEHMMDGPASSASTTAADMARFMLAMLNNGMLNGQRAYGPATANALRTPLLDGAQTNRWAHGLIMSALPGGHIGYGHEGYTTTTSSSLIVVPDLNLGIFAVANTGDGGKLVYNLADEIVRTFYAPDAPSAKRPRPGVLSFAREADRYNGTYLSVRRPYHGLAELVIATPQQVWVDEAGYLHAPKRGADNRWVPSGPAGAFVDAEGEQVLAFAFDENGRAVSYREPRASATLERISPVFAMPIFLGIVAVSVMTSLILIITAAVRFFRRNRATPRTASLASFDRVQFASAVVFLLAATCAAVSAITSDQASGASFPPPPLRAFAVLNCILLVIVLGMIVSAATPWRAGGKWTRILRILAIVPFAIYVVRIGAFGGMEFWE